MKETISLQEIIKIIKKRLVLIIALTVIGCGVAAGISIYAITPIYDAQTQILVNQKGNADQVYSLQTTNTDLSLINTYQVIITSPVILNPVLESLDLDKTTGQLAQQISVFTKTDSKVVNIRVEDPNPAVAVDIANTLAEVFKENIPQLMSIDNISILSAAKLSENPSPVKPDILLNSAIGAVIGLMLGFGLTFLLEFLDMSIKGERDVEDYLQLPVIGMVDFIKEEKEKKLSLRVQKAGRS
ncbi:Wzz/FepE/Etk N-terminal domain-containing protein [Solibacillus sp. FSL W7-1436]|uniref:YveK family protein n=1 Tax=Solibacillus sp. FSL W7-1436 TaxID=2921705 RepID=UPI0030FC6193